MPHGRVQISRPMAYPSVSRLLRRFVFVWTADVDGNADGEFTPPLTGKLLRVLSFLASTPNVLATATTWRCLTVAASMFSAAKVMGWTAASRPTPLPANGSTMIRSNCGCRPPAQERAAESSCSCESRSGRLDCRPTATADSPPPSTLLRAIGTFSAGLPPLALSNASTAPPVPTFPCATSWRRAWRGRSGRRHTGSVPGSLSRSRRQTVYPLGGPCRRRSRSASAPPQSNDVACGLLQYRPPTCLPKHSRASKPGPASGHCAIPSSRLHLVVLDHALGGPALQRLAGGGRSEFPGG
jgi:hypothetical protein